MGVDRAEAEEVVRAELAKLRAATYSELVERLLDKQESFERVGPSGVRYTIELDAFWDDRPSENLRVIAMVDDGSRRAFRRPLSDSFIRAPDDSFIGE